MPKTVHGRTIVSVKVAPDWLTQLQTLTVQEQLQRQTVDVFFKLLSDPSDEPQIEQITTQINPK